MNIEDIAGLIFLGGLVLCFLVIVVGLYSDEIIEIIRAIKE